MSFMSIAKGRSLFKKSISALLIQAFLLSNIAFAVPKEDEISLSKGPEIITDPEKIVIPRDFSLVKSKFTGSDDRLLIHIQDAHCNYEAQSNIAKILESLIKNYGLALVSVEGADGVVDTSWFKAFPDQEIRKEVADYFMKKGEITGPEFLSITTDYPIKLFGAETRSHYIQNLNAFMSSYPVKDAAEKHFNQIKTVLNRLKNYIYSEELKTMDARIEDYESKKMQFNDYVRFLEVMAERHKINPRSYDNFFKLMSTLIYEKKIDFNVTDKERSALIDELSKRISKEALTELIARSLAFKSNKVSSAEYYNYLKALAHENDIELAKRYPNLYNYIIYNAVYSRIENEKLFNDIKSIEIAIKEKLFKNDDQRTLEKLSRHIEILLGLVNIKLLNGDFEYYQAHPQEFAYEAFSDFIMKKSVQFGLSYGLEAPDDAIAKSIPQLVDFYSIAIKRDNSLVDNTLQEMTKSKVQLAVLVTGGFHSDGITKLLERQKVSYMVVCPNITKDVPSPYFQILTNQRTPFEDILVPPVEAKEAKKGLLAPYLISRARGLGIRQRGLDVLAGRIVRAGEVEQEFARLYIKTWITKAERFAGRQGLPHDRNILLQAFMFGVDKAIKENVDYQEHREDIIELAKGVFDEVYERERVIPFATAQASDLQARQANLAELRTIVENSKGIEEFLAIVNDKDAGIVGEALRGLIKEIFRIDGATAIMVHEERTRRGQLLGLLDAMKNWASRNPGSFKEGVSLGIMMPGQGTRFSPFTQRLFGIKPFMPMLIRANEKGQWLTGAAASIYTWNLIAYHLERMGFEGIAWKWGDEPQIPVTRLSGLDMDLSNADIVRFGSRVVVSDELAGNKEWLNADGSGNLTGWARRRPRGALLEKLGISDTPDAKAMVHLGSPAFSYLFIEKAQEVFSDVPSDKWLDVDGYLIEALTLNKEEWDAEQRGERERNIKGIDEVLSQVPDFYERAQRLKVEIEKVRGRPLEIKVIDFGEGLYWGDIGQLSKARATLHQAAAEGPEGEFARALAAIGHIERDKFGNWADEKSVYPKDGSVKNSVLINAKIYGLSNIDNTVLVDSTLGDVRIGKGSVVYGSTVKNLTMGERAFSLYSISEDLRIEDDWVHTSMPKNPKDIKEGLEDWRADSRIDVGKKEFYTVPAFGNPRSFKEEQEIMRQRDVAPGDIENGLMMHFVRPLIVRLEEIRTDTATRQSTSGSGGLQSKKDTSIAILEALQSDDRGVLQDYAEGRAQEQLRLAGVFRADFIEEIINTFNGSGPKSRERTAMVFFLNRLMRNEDAAIRQLARREREELLNDDLGLGPTIEPDIYKRDSIRAIADLELPDSLVEAAGTAYVLTVAELLREKAPSQIVIGVGRESRVSGERILNAFIRGATSMGATVIDVTNGGVERTSTPLMYFASRYLEGGKLDGVVELTASHLKGEFNGLKATAGFNNFTADEMQKWLELTHTVLDYGIPINNRYKGKVRRESVLEPYWILCGAALRDAIEDYPQWQALVDEVWAGKTSLKKAIDTIRPEVTSWLETKPLKDKKFSADSGFGSMGPIVGTFLRDLAGASLMDIGAEADYGKAVHDANPNNPDNLKMLAENVADTAAIFGMGFDVDGDRLGIVSLQGKILRGDDISSVIAPVVITQAIAKAEEEGKKDYKPVIVLNVLSSDRLKQVVKDAGGISIESAVGFNKVKEAMTTKLHELYKEQYPGKAELLPGQTAEMGVEISSHIMFKENFNADDAFFAVIKLLGILAREAKRYEEKGQTIPANFLDTMLDRLPKDYHTGEWRTPMVDNTARIEVAEKMAAHYEKLAQDNPGRFSIRNRLDGLKIEFLNEAGQVIGWLAIRPSGTSPELVVAVNSLESEEAFKNIKKNYLAQMVKYKDYILINKLEPEAYKKEAEDAIRASASGMTDAPRPRSSTSHSTLRPRSGSSRAKSRDDKLRANAEPAEAEPRRSTSGAAEEIVQSGRPIYTTPSEGEEAYVLKEYAWKGTGISRWFGWPTKRIAEWWINSTHKDGLSKMPGTGITYREVIGANPDIEGEENPILLKVLGKDETQPQIVHIGFNEDKTRERFGTGTRQFQTFYVALSVQERQLMKQLRKELERIITTAEQFAEYQQAYSKWVSDQTRKDWTDATKMMPTLPFFMNRYEPKLNEIYAKLWGVRKGLFHYLNRINLTPGQMILSPVGYVHSIVGSHQGHPLTGPNAKNEAWYIFSAGKDDEGRELLLYFESQQMSNITFSPFDIPTGIDWSPKENRVVMRKDIGTGLDKGIEELLQPGEGKPTTDEDVIKLIAERAFHYVGTKPEDFIVRTERTTPRPTPPGMYTNAKAAQAETLIDETLLKEIGKVWPRHLWTQQLITLKGEGEGNESSITVNPQGERLTSIVVLEGAVEITRQGETKILPQGSSAFYPGIEQVSYEIKSKGEAKVMRVYPPTAPRDEAAITGPTVTITKAERTTSSGAIVEEGAERKTAEEIYSESTEPDRVALKQLLDTLRLSGTLDNRIVIIGYDTGLEPELPTGQVAQAGERAINRYLDDRLINVRATGQKLADEIKAAISQLPAGTPYAVVTIAGDATISQTKEELTGLGKVLNVQNPDDRYIPIIGLYELALKIAYDLSPDEILASLNRIALNPDNRPFARDELESLLAGKIIRLLPKIVPLNLTEAHEAYKAAQKVLMAL